MPTDAPSGTAAYRYLIFLGNNSDLVRVTLQRRAWWQSAIEDEDGKGVVNTLMPGSLFGGPPRLDYTKHKLLCEDSLLANSFDFTWRPTLGMKLNTGQIATLHTIEGAPGGASAKQLVNHYPSVKCIASKTGLLRSLFDYYTRLGIEPFDNVPTTFVLRNIGTSGAADYQAFCSHFRSLSNGDLASCGEKLPAKHCTKNMWLVKPSYLNQGKGIKVFNELTPLKEHLMSVDRGGLVVDGAAVAASAEWVVQKYIERPLLLHGGGVSRKFDLRIWVVATDNFDIYVYNDGYVRTSSEHFSTNLGGAAKQKRAGGGNVGEDSVIMQHLTNYCAQVSASIRTHGVSFSAPW
jgi:Tubulin-tyrosine ligase family